MKILVISPHPDDETLGCGGTLLRHKDEEDELNWIIMTTLNKNMGWTDFEIDKRESEIKKVTEKYDFNNVFNLSISTTKIDTLPISELVNKIGKIYNKTKPEIIYMPYVYDVHSDHRVTAKAFQSTFKWFRYPFIKKVMMYEVLSETEFNFINKVSFKPNIFVDISDYLDEKIEIMKIYDGEMGKFPFPRSEKNIRSLSYLRGCQSGFNSAEAFELVYERR